MKINLLVNNPEGVRSGFVNLDPLAQQDDPARIPCELSDLTMFVDDGEVTELLAVDVIDYIPAQQKEVVLSHWLKKVAFDGTITIGGLDIYQVAHAIENRQINLVEANRMLYGESVQRNGLVNCGQMASLLATAGYEILQKKIFGYNYLVTAKRVN